MGPATQSDLAGNSDSEIDFTKTMLYKILATLTAKCFNLMEVAAWSVCAQIK
jgi:hypothetical protein